MCEGKLFITVLAVAAVLCATAPVASAAVVASSSFDAPTLAEEGWYDFGEPGMMWLDTDANTAEFFKDGADGGQQIQWEVPEVSSYMGDGDVWTISLDFRNDIRTDPLINEIILAIGQNNVREAPGEEAPDRMVKILFDEHDPGYWRFRCQQQGTDDPDVVDLLPFGEWYHIDIVFNKSGSTISNYQPGSSQDILDNNADMWLNGELAVWDYALTPPDGRGMVEEDPIETIALRVDKNQEGWATFDNFEIRDGIYVADAPVVIPGTMTWEADSGDWNVGGNWNPAEVPSDNTHSAIFGDAIQQDSTVFTSTLVTVKDITFDSANNYRIAGEGLTLDGDSADATVQVTATAGEDTHKFQLPVTLAGNTDVDVDTGAELIFDGPLDLGGFTITKLGTGLLSINNGASGNGTIDVQGGTVGGHGTIVGDLIVSAAAAVAPGNSIGTLAASTATIADGGTYVCEVQGTSNDLLAVDGTLTMGSDSIQLDWLEGSDATSKFGGTYTIATYDSLDGTPTLSLGNIGAAYVDTVVDTGTALEVTLHGLGDGDTNLDGTVSSGDLTGFGQGWGSSSPAWADGDFNFDGVVNSLDLADFGQAWGWSAGSAGAAAGISPVPEPGTIVMLLIGVAGLLLYRKRR